MTRGCLIGLVSALYTLCVFACVRACVRPRFCAYLLVGWLAGRLAGSLAGWSHIDFKWPTGAVRLHKSIARQVMEWTIIFIFEMLTIYTFLYLDVKVPPY